MSDKQKVLEGSRKRIDEIDEQILDLLSERAEVVNAVIKTKVENQLPVFVPKREDEKSASFKKMAQEKELILNGRKIF